MDNLVTTPRERSIIMFLDSDILTHPGFVNNVFKQTVRGKVRCQIGCHWHPQAEPQAHGADTG